MVSEGLCHLPADWAGKRGWGTWPTHSWSPSLIVFLCLLQAKFLSQDQINGRLGLLFN